ncbi:MAG: class I adenylate-forming enzyme family protein [Halobacteriota archaeon]
MEPVQLDFDDRPVRDHTVKSLLETRTDLFGDDPFLFYGHDDSTFSFREVNEISNAIANSLLGLGVEKGEKVSTMIENQLYGVLSMFGTYKGGMVYAPINYEFRGETLSYQINDVDAAVIIAEDQFLGKLNAVKDDLEDLPHVVVYETDADAEELDDDFETSSFEDLLDGDESNPDVSVEWDDTSSIIYTSGTTGHPKGVVVPYRWIIYYCAMRWQVMNREDVVHCPLPLYHGAGPYWDIAAALIVGAPVALWDKYSPSRFIDRVNKYEATTCTLMSVMHSWLWDQPEKEDDHRNTLNKVQMSPLADYHKDLAERFSIDFITSKFGQQESGNPVGGFVHAARGEHATPEDLRRGYPPEVVVERAEEMGIPVVEEAPAEQWIGNPTPWADVQIVNERDEPLGPNQIGELVARPRVPSAMFKEYYNRPNKTLEEFSNLWFHIGDAAYYDEDGNYFFVDRIGHIIRRRGENISGEQLEDIAIDHGDIAEVAVVPLPSEDGGEDEIAFVVKVRDDATLTEEDLRAYLEPRVADFMLPDHVRFVDEIPMTHTNKIRKKEIRQTIFGYDE